MGGSGSTRRVTFEADENENITVVKGVRVSAGPARGSPERCGLGLAPAPLLTLPLPFSRPRVPVCALSPLLSRFPPSPAVISPLPSPVGIRTRSRGKL